MKDLKINNSSENILTVIVEPWAEEISINPKSLLHLQVESNESGLCEITYQESERIIVWFWRGCTLIAHIDEQKLDMPSLLIRTVF